MRSERACPHVQSFDAHFAAESLLSAGYVGYRENGGDSGERVGAGKRIDDSVRAAFLRPCGTACVAAFPDRRNKECAHRARGLGCFSSLQHEKTRSEERRVGKES